MHRKVMLSSLSILEYFKGQVHEPPELASSERLTENQILGVPLMSHRDTESKFI